MPILGGRGLLTSEHEALDTLTALPQRRECSQMRLARRAHAPQRLWLWCDCARDGIGALAWESTVLVSAPTLRLAHPTEPGRALRDRFHIPADLLLEPPRGTARTASHATQRSDNTPRLPKWAGGV